jgi:PhoPQ-activated pathogenicity-related protein
MSLLDNYARDNGDTVDGFILTGGSKRGWTCWLTAAMDKRVTGVVPSTFDNLNVAANEPQIEFWGKLLVPQ